MWSAWLDTGAASLARCRCSVERSAVLCLYMFAYCWFSALRVQLSLLMPTNLIAAFIKSIYMDICKVILSKSFRRVSLFYEIMNTLDRHTL